MNISTSWSAGPWVGAAPAYGGGSTQYLQFNNTAGSAITTSNDLGAGFLLNGINFSGTNSTSGIAVNNLSGNALRFVSNGIDQPLIQQLGAGIGTLGAAVNLGTTLHIAGSGAGNLQLTGHLSGTHGLNVTRNTASLSISGANSFSGYTTLNSGTLFVSHSGALGQSTLIVNGGRLQSVNSQFINLSNPVVTNQPLTVTLASTGILYLSGNISGGGGVKKLGAGLMYLTGNNAYGGATEIESNVANTVTEIRYVNDNALGQPGTPIILRDTSGGTGIAALTYFGQGTSTLNHDIQILSGAEAALTPISSYSSIVITGNISGDGDLRLGNYSRSGVIELAGNNTYSGQTRLVTGTTRFDSDARFGNSQFIILNGGAAMLSGNWDSTRDVSIDTTSGINTNGFDADLPLGLLTTTPASADFNPVLYKSGLGSLRLGNTVGGALTVNAGNVTLYDAGTSEFTPSGSSTQAAVTLNRGGAFTLDNTSTNHNNRLPDTGTVALAGGTLNLLGNALSPTSESLGTISVAANTHNVIHLQPAGMNVQINLATLSNSGGSILYRGPGLGSTSQITFTNAPALVGGAGASGTPLQSILPRSFGEDTAIVDGNGFVTVDGGSLRLLSGTEYAATITSGASTLNNVSISAAASGINSSTTINSLCLLGGASVSGTSTLGINSGMVLAPDNATTTIATGTLALGSNGFIRNSGTLNVSAQINAGSFNKSGGGVLSVSAPITTSRLHLHDGIFRNGAANIVPDSAIVMVNGGASWQLNGNSETVYAISQQDLGTSGGGSYGEIDLSGATLTLNTTGSSETYFYTGRLIGNGALVKTGAGSMALNGQNNTFSGGIILRQGTLRANSLSTVVGETLVFGTSAIQQLASAESRLTGEGDDILGAGSIQFDVTGNDTAELRLSDTVQSLSRAIVVDGGGNGTARLTSTNRPTVTSPITLNRNLLFGTGGGTLSGLISGGGGLTHLNVLAAGSVYPPATTLTGLNTYSGTTTVQTGSLHFAQDVAHGAPGPFGNAVSAIVIGDPSGAVPAEISAVAGGITMSRPISTVSTGTGNINIVSRAPGGSGATYAGTLTINRAARLFSAENPADNSVGTLNVTGPITGSAALTIGQPFDALNSSIRSRCNVILSSSSSNLSNSMILASGALGINASSSGSTGPLGSGTFIIGVSGAVDVPAIYALGAPRSVHNNVTFNNHVYFNGSQPLTFAGDVALGGAERTLYVNGSTVSFNGVVSGGGALTKAGTGTLVLGSATTHSGPTAVLDGRLIFGASQQPSSLNIGPGAVVEMQPGGNKLLRTANLNMTPGATLDLNDADAILDYTSASPLLPTRLRIIQGFNNGSWDGGGIRSTMAAGALGPSAGLGYAEASSAPAGAAYFGVDATTILIRYTGLGDADLSGTVDSVDFTMYLAGYGISSSALWTDGDFNYDGKVNTLDFNLLAANFGQSIASPLPGGAPVPEPFAASLLSILALLQRRRRHVEA